jgi:NhaP-type Na+/H+ or K+/H+ antiporter
VLAAATADTLNDSLLVLGGLLVLGALIAGYAHRSFLSLTAVFVGAGLLLGEAGFEVLEFDEGSGFVAALATVALVLILFRDGLEVEAEMLQSAWRLPFRKLVLAMPLTCVIVAVATHALTDLDWTESFLLGALLSPTDPVLSSSVVTNPRVPRVIRHSLNLESGLNDGLALPAVLAFTAAAASESDFVWWEFVLQDVTVGFVTGAAVGLAASYLMPRGRALGTEVSAHQKAMFGLGVAFAAYGLAVLPPEGNGLISTFVAAIVLGIRRPDIRASFEGRAEDILEVVKLGVFVVFGSLFTIDELFADGWAAVAIVAITLLVARPVAVFASLVRSDTDVAERAFMSWFGPKGVATMTFALLVLAESPPAGKQVAAIAALAVLTSIFAHGLTDHPGAEWMARHAERKEKSAAEPVPG